jgi:YHS domain-containing protein
MTRSFGRLSLLGAAALVGAATFAFADDPAKKSAKMDDMCAGHHSAAMKASDDLGTHLAEAKRSTTLSQMRTHVEAADKAYGEMKTHLSQCMETMHGGKMEHGMMGMGSSAATAAKIVDPVCNMEVADVKTAPTAVYKGKTYYFCSEEDKAKFEKNPEQYLKS